MQKNYLMAMRMVLMVILAIKAEKLLLPAENWLTKNPGQFDRDFLFNRYKLSGGIGGFGFSGSKGFGWKSIDLRHSF
jgi:hypothetical protein